MKTLLVSLISDQTIPNVQLINEMKEEVTNFLFLTTKGMEKRGVRNWIIQTTKIEESKFLITKEVNEYDFKDISEKLNEIDWDEYDKILVNLTGGTKIMTLAVSEFFNLKGGAEIYYVTGKDDEYLKLFPKKKINTFKFSSKISVADYLKSYGFSYSESSDSRNSFHRTKTIFENYCKLNIDKNIEALKFIYSKRKKKISSEEFPKVAHLLNELGFYPSADNCLNKKETEYLSGNWFEEYIGARIKEELKLSDNEIILGATIEKELPHNKKNDINILLNFQTNDAIENSRNEMDVMFVYKNKFYTIECKTSIISYIQTSDKEGKPKEKQINILGETLYKSDSLSRRFGLFANTAIATLTDFSEYCRTNDNQIDNNKFKQMSELIGRSNLSNIKLIDKKMLCNTSNIFELVK